MIRTVLQAMVLLAWTACGGRVTTGDVDTDAAEVEDPAGEEEQDVVTDPVFEPDGESDDPPTEPPCDPEDPILEEKGPIALGETVEDQWLSACGEHRYSFVAARGSQMQISLMAHGHHRVTLDVIYPDDPLAEEPIETFESVTGGVEDVFTFAPPRSGEFVMALRPSDPVNQESYDLGLDCGSGCDLVTTRYPIVLVHGWTGFDSIGPIGYFYGIFEMLRDQGYLVYVAELDPYNHVEIRSEQLALEVDDFLSWSHSRKVNLVAHSQGGLDSRRLISTLGYGDRVSALVTIATPHRGTPLTDIALGLLPGPGEEALYFMLELLGATAVGSESDAEASFESMTTSYVQDTFNPANPDDPRVSYISYKGKTCPLGITCGDVCDVEIRWSYDLIYLQAGDNDGIVPVSSASWGDDRGELAADHFDEVGQLFGVTGPNFDHEEFYSEVALDLALEAH